MAQIRSEYIVDYEFDTEESGNPPPWISLMDFAQELVSNGLMYGISKRGAIAVELKGREVQRFDHIGFKLTYKSLGDGSFGVFGKRYVVRELEMYIGREDADLRWTFESRLIYEISHDTVTAFSDEYGEEEWDDAGPFLNWYAAQQELYNRFQDTEFMVGNNEVSLKGVRSLEHDAVPEAFSTKFHNLTVIRRGGNDGGMQGISRDVEAVTVTFGDQRFFVKPARPSKRPVSALEGGSSSGSGAGAGDDRSAARPRKSEEDRSATACYDEEVIRALLVHHGGDVDAVAQALMTSGLLDKTKQLGQKIKGAVSRKPTPPARSIAAIQTDLDNTQVILKQFLKDPKRDQNPAYQEQVRRLGQLRTELAAAKAKSASAMYSL